MDDELIDATYAQIQTRATDRGVTWQHPMYCCDLKRGAKRVLWCSQIAPGHPEGYLEAFATIYADFARVIRTGERGLLPGTEDGVEGVASVAACVASSKNDAAWTELDL